MKAEAQHIFSEFLSRDVITKSHALMYAETWEQNYQLIITKTLYRFYA